ncbi:Tox-REase-5 domain-containing protein, partial [Burkholderia stagnalis]|uniref:Tox-REase-5 domain-containing protein n=1 Tax=Burkholderia stagnalis TaxID=1503054 RepID=UPI00387E05DC
MSDHSREYQARITGRPYSNEGKWNEEWVWEGIAFDGFLPAECMLQEAKAHYAQFLQRDDEGELEPLSWFKGFPGMVSDIERQGGKERWPRSFGQVFDIFKWNVRGSHAAD